MRLSINALLVLIGFASSMAANVAAANYDRLDVNNAAFLFVDHQVGLLNLVQDTNPDSLKNTILGLADTAKFFNSSVILSSSRADGPNGPLLPELMERFPDAPYIARPGQINAWDDPDFVKAVKATGKTQLIISGIVTDVCVTFLSLSAKAAGFDVFVVIDASGTFNEAIRDASWLRMQAAGIQLVNFFSVACELARDWRIDITGLGNLFAEHIPTYKNIIDAYAGAVASVSQ